MRAVVQRVSSASVQVEGRVVGEIGRGLLVFAGIAAGDAAPDLSWMAEKVVNLRIFPDEPGKMNVSVADVGGDILVVSQFTLYGDCQKGNRPSFIDAARPEIAEPLYETFASALRLHDVRVATGRFAADMQVELVNDGPVTLVIDAPAAGRAGSH